MLQTTTKMNFEKMLGQQVFKTTNEKKKLRSVSLFVKFVYQCLPLAFTVLFIFHSIWL